MMSQPTRRRELFWAREKRSSQNTTTTTLEQFAEEALRNVHGATLTVH